MSPRRSPWQRFYGWAHRRRRRYWAARAEGLGRPTVSVGNLHWGGSGKTPTVVAIARGLAGRGLRVAVLSRGYRRRGRQPLIVSLGEGPLAPVEQAGDEPVMIAEQTAVDVPRPGGFAPDAGGDAGAPSGADAGGDAGAPSGADAGGDAGAPSGADAGGDAGAPSEPGAVVVVGADRRAAAALALERAPAIDVFVLDDGFSHVQVRRDVEVLTFPAVDPFAGGLLLPGGRLREPLQNVRLADAVVLTGLEAGDEPPEDFEPTLRRQGFKGPVFTSTLRAEWIVVESPDRPHRGRAPAQGARRTDTNRASGAPPVRPLLVTGVARPERVARTAAATGLECVDHLRFPDHHRYPQRSLRAIEAACARHRSDAVVVTSKDAVKLRGRLPEGAPRLLELKVEARIDPGFLPWLTRRLVRT